MKKYLTLVLLSSLVLSLLSGYSLDVSAEENEDPYKDFIMDELFREEGQEEEYFQQDSGLMFSSSSTYSSTSICDFYDVLSDAQKTKLSSVLSSSSYNFILVDSAKWLYFGQNVSFTGSVSAAKPSATSLSYMTSNGTVTNVASSMMQYLTFNLSTSGVFKYIHKSGTRLIDDFTFSMKACEITTYTLTLSAGSGGSVTGGGQYTNKQTAVIEATPYPHYDFVSWSDGNIDNPRSLVLSSNLSLTAEFREHPKYDVSVSVIGNGTVEGIGQYYADTKVLLSAVPEEGYYFVRWSDGSTDVLKEITVSSDINLTAYFEKYEPSACKFSTQLLEDTHIFNLIKTVQTAFESGRSEWSDWVIYKKFVWLDWNTELIPYSYEINFPVWSYYEIQSLNDSSLYYRSDIERREGYITFYTPIFVYDDVFEELVIDSYTQDTFTLVPDVPLQFTDRNGDTYKLTPVTVTSTVMTKTCFGEGYDDAKMQDMQYGVLSQILSFLQNSLTGLGNEQEVTNKKLDSQIELQEQQNGLVIEQNNKMDTHNQLIQDQFSVNTDDNFGVQGLTTVAGEKMGVLSFLGESTYVLLDVFDPAGVPEPVLEFPSFDINVSGRNYKVWDGIEFDFSVLDDYFGGFMDVVRSVTTLMVWLAVINYCIKEFERFWRS